MDYKSFEIKLDAKQDDNSRTFSGYGSTFGNIDSDNDIIVKGAFTESLKKRNPKLLYQHKMSDVIGVINNAYEDEKGLFIEGKISNTTKGNEAYELLKDGAIDSFSVGFMTKDSDYKEDGVRLIKQAELYEVSIVTFPANEQARISSVKAEDINTIRDFENFLREVGGYSQKQAKLIASKGYKAMNQEHREDDNDEIVQLLKDTIKQLKK